MRTMAVELQEHLTRTGSATRLLPQLGARLEDPAYDIESLIDDLDKICGVGTALAAFGESPIDPELVSAAQEARSETEWFVQAACERLHPDDAELVWTPLLRCSDTTTLTIATTNYDRAIEIAAQRLSLSFDDGFEPFGTREWTPWRGIEAPNEMRLLKIHGSTDWYRVSDTDDVVKLRHPMPLFGGVSLRLTGESPGYLGSALVLPSREKLKNLPPFPDLSHELYASAKDADAAVFVGSSLRDPDLKQLCRSICERGIPTLVVGRSAAREPEGAAPAASYVLRQSASTFLISTLPRLVRELGLTHDRLREVADGNQYGTESLLPHLRMLTAPESSTSARSNAIETLWRLRADIGAEMIRTLLGDGRGPIAVDALGLVPTCGDAPALLAHAEELAMTSGEAAFQSEVALLRQVLEAGNERQAG
jgi:hypothetical protein